VQKDFFNSIGQNRLLPHRNTIDRFSPINRHYLTVTFPAEYRACVNPQR
jgi:hypothetical protein